MHRIKPAKIKPIETLYELRKSVSEILGEPIPNDAYDNPAYITSYVKIFKPHQKVLAIWAADCAEHVLPYFEKKYPDDDRPRKAIGVLHAWIRGEIKGFREARAASITVLAAARGKKEEDAVFAARSAQQAVATPHVSTHALGASLYAIRAVAAHTGNVDDGLIKERNWQMEHLRKHAKQSGVLRQ